MNATNPEASPMLIVDCPLCERPAPFDTDHEALECEACGVRLEMADDAQVELPIAA